MNLTNYFFGSKTTETETEMTQSNTKIYLLYGCKVSYGNETSYVVGIFNDENLAIEELDRINKIHNLTNVGRLIICKETGLKEYHYRYFLVDCELNKNYGKSIENVMYG